MKSLIYGFSLWLMMGSNIIFAAQDINIQHWQTSKGAKVYFIPAPELPMLDVRVVFNAGATRDGSLPGLAMLTHSLLDQGAASLSADDIAQQLESVGAKLGGGSERDMAWLSLRTLTEPALMDKALQILADVLSHPDFNEADFMREQKRTLVGLRLAQERPGTIGQQAFYKVLYKEHPYASAVDGDALSISAIKRDDLQTFYQRYYVTKNTILSIVGDVDRAQAERIAERVTKDMKQGKRAMVLSAPTQLTASSELYIKHGSQQSHILLGQLGVKRGDADYYALYAGNYILGGGGLVSRLSDEVREKRGLSYSVYSYFIPMREQGPFMLGLQTRNDQTAEALSVVRDTLADFVANGPTDDEVEAAIQHITGGFPLRIDSNRKMVEYLAMIGFYDLPLTYLEDFNGHIKRLSRAKIHDAFQRRLDPKRMATVVVGGEDVFAKH